MIHRLGLSHALGSQKRFVVRADRQQYQPDQKALITVEAFDGNSTLANDLAYQILRDLEGLSAFRTARTLLLSRLLTGLNPVATRLGSDCVMVCSLVLDH